MAYILRLVLPFVLLLISGFSYSAVPKGYLYFPVVGGVSYSGSLFPSAEAACLGANSLAPYPIGSWASAAWSMPGYSNSCVHLNIYGKVTNTTGISISSLFSCPSNSSESGSSCVCDSGYDEKDGQCVKQKTAIQKRCESYAGDSFSGVEVVGSGLSSPPGVICDEQFSSSREGCVGTFFRDYSIADAEGNYHHFGTVTYTASGQTCTGTDDFFFPEPTPEEPEPEPIPKGENRPCKNGYQGSFNGVDVCVPFGDSSKGVGDVSKTETVDDGQGNVTEKVTNQKVECDGAKCTTTTTVTTTSNGGTPSTETTTSATTRPDFCRSNPSNPLCGAPGGSDGKGDEDSSGSAFGGSCGAFTCDGDAVQCAIALEQHNRACQVLDNMESQEAALYNASKGKTGSVTGDLPGNASVTFGSEYYDDTPALGSGLCVSDMTIEVMGKNVTLPISEVCPYVSLLRTILLAIGALLWMVIVFKG